MGNVSFAQLFMFGFPCRILPLMWKFVMWHMTWYNRYVETLHQIEHDSLSKFRSQMSKMKRLHLHCRNDRNIGFKASYQYGRYDFLLDLTTCCSWCACATKIIHLSSTANAWSYLRRAAGLLRGKKLDTFAWSWRSTFGGSGSILGQAGTSSKDSGFFSDAILLVQFVVYPWNPFKLCLSEFLVMGPGMGIGWKTVFPGWPLTLVSFDLLLPAKKGQGAEYTSQMYTKSFCNFKQQDAEI